MNNRDLVILYTLYIFLVFVWGTSFILMKQGLKEFTALEVGNIRILLCGLIFFPFGIKSLLKQPKKVVWNILQMAALGTMIPSVLFPLSMTKIDSSVSAIINALTPIFTVVTGMILFRLKVFSWQWAGLFIAFLGTVAIIVFKDSSSFDVSVGYYALICTLGPLCYGLNINITKTHLSSFAPMELTALGFTLSFPIELALFLCTDAPEKISTNGLSMPLLSIVTLSLFSTGVGTIFYNYLIKKMDVIFVSNITYFIPLVAIFWGFQLGESLHILQAAGTLLVFLGVYLVRRRTPIQIGLSNTKPPKNV